LNRAVMAEMRTLLQELRPEILLKTNISLLFQQLVTAAKGRKESEAQVVIEGSEESLPTDVRIAFFRIAQECINNIVKHSEATEYSIYLQIEPESAQLEIRDNGKGFDMRVADDGFGFGLDNIRERAESIGAALEIQSQPGDDTTVSVIWKNEGEVAA
jgi:signal transduction histidine kinase